MALFGSYAEPGVYTDVVISGGGQPLFGDALIPVLIGEGLEYFAFSNKEIHRGSSSVADDQAVGENISDQITGMDRSFHTTYFPVVTGDGSGTVTTNPANIQVTADGVPVTVITLDGTTGNFVTQDIILLGQDLQVTYYFKRTDTLISNESLSGQVPQFASLTVSGASSSSVVLSTTIPGAVGNLISLTLTDSGSGAGSTDALAVSGVGSDTISIDIRKADHTVRTVVDLATLVAAGIPTYSAGYLTAGTPTGTGILSTASLTHFASGAGPNTNTTFKTSRVPIVDGSNGGVVTTKPTDVSVYVSGVKVGVVSVDGQHGLVTLAQPVTFTGSQPPPVTITYYTNTYQNTFDLLPASNVASITNVGLGPDRSDYTNGVDYVLGIDANGNGTINWGASTATVSGKATTGYTPFGATQITTTLVDEKVYLRPLTGVSNGKNTVFTLQDVPVDGSGLATVTDNPSLISVYVGVDPVSAASSPAVQVARLAGATGTVMLYNPPQTGQNVYASYWRNTLNDHSYTLTVVNPSIPGQGNYTVTDEVGRLAAVAAPNLSSSHVADANFATTGIVWPSAASDLTAALGEPTETVTLSFQDDGLTVITQPAVQAYVTTQTILFTATTPGTGGNSVTITFTSVGTADATAITGGGTNTLTVDIQKADTSVRTISEIVALFAAYPVAATTTAGGVILATGSGTGQAATASAVHLAHGVNQVSVPYANRFLVTTSRTTQDAVADGKGLTGGATTPSGTNTTLGYSGYLGQTYVDPETAVKFTLVDPSAALGYGYTQLPSPRYYFNAGDTVVLTLTSGGNFTTGLAPIVALPGLATKVSTTFGAEVGDTAIVSTYNKSGNNPNVGEYYYVSFTTSKTAQDFEIKLWNSPTDAYAVYGQPTAYNRLSLGIYFLTANGAQTFGTIQVPKQTGLNTASDEDYIAAIQSLVKALPGTTRKADRICALSTSMTVLQFLSHQTITQATPRNKAEGMAFVGFSAYADSPTIRSYARSLKNARVVGVGNPALGVVLTDSNTSVGIEYAVDGSFAAAGLMGLSCNPANDVATSLTRQNVVGFSRPLTTFDDPTMNMMASDGLTMLVNNNGALQVRHYLSTDQSNPITANPICTSALDYTRQQFRTDLDQFIGRKLVDSLVSDITVVCNSRLRSLTDNNLISGYKNLVVIPDATDPTTVDVSVMIKPMFSLDYIMVTFTVTTSL